MPSVGQGNEKVNFPYDAEGIKAAEKYAQATGGQGDYAEQASEAPGMRSNISLGYEEGGKVPMSDGAARSVQTYPGGGKTGYNVMDKYEAGGKAEDETGGKVKAAKMQKQGKAKKKETGKKQKPISDKLRKIIEHMEGLGKKTPKRPWEPKKPGFGDRETLLQKDWKTKTKTKARRQALAKKYLRTKNKK